ncbi:PREDICTED: zinc finger protein with KRAB and SCAN domains 1-like isoform X2 [Cyprinodon variegatus]|uniref:zinc finger protein with KRAB and SCAN domains 1-like isoform X2 n=1 Tax=Cyprinodon variegatus TaxID=28743 RepID=UPI00074253FC|nr:PREDICTED: zinc finger protein with KRAB and SCAN domains 1-like isoform X2 [Cyprinodon variegatus]
MAQVPQQPSEERTSGEQRADVEQQEEEPDSRTLTAAAAINVKEEAPDADQQELHRIKEEQLSVKEEEETHDSSFPSVPVKTEEEEEKPLFFQLHPHKTEDAGFPIRASAEHIKVEMKEEDSGTAETSRNTDLKSHGGSGERGEDSETEDSEEDREESRVPESDTNTVSKSGKQEANRSIQSRSTPRSMTSGRSIDEKWFTETKEEESLKKNTKQLNCSDANMNTREKLFDCTVCEIRFTRKHSLDMHMRNHTGEKPFVCDACGKGFTTTSNLNTHKLSHNGGNVFVCDACGKAFSSSAYLKMHKRIHSEEKPFVCDACGKGFTFNSYLKTHKIIHHGENPLRCDICGKRCASTSYFNRHMEIHYSAEKLGGKKLPLVDILATR